MSATATIDQFLGEISQILQQRAALQLQAYLIIEPPYSDLYHTLINEVRAVYSKGNEDALEAKCSAALPVAREGEDNATWTAFLKFMAQYLVFLRDVNTDNLLDTYNLLSELVQKCNSALVHPTLGVLVLPTVITYSRVLARLAIGLDKQPHLIAHLNQQSTDESGARETLPERAANIIRQAFVTCLNARSGSSSTGRSSKPEGKKTGIYKVANLCLKVLFQCKKTRNAEQMFVNIDNQSPPIWTYPRSERVTYLYYLGRFHFSTNHFWRAQLALQEAYRECHVQCFKQRRLILIYLIASNIILGRFPSTALLARKEAQGLAEKFLPICRAIQKGDLATFHEHVELHSPHAAWFSQFRIRIQLKTRCEVLVWRSLFRKTFLISGFVPSSNSRSAPTFTLSTVLHLAQFLLRNQQRREDSNASVDPDLADIDTKSGPSGSSNINMLEIESIASSLVVQKFLNGFVSHKQLRFAITGAKKKPALEAGFPNVWQTIKAASTDQVPGWVRGSRGPPTGGFGPGMVVNLKNSRPVGVGA